MKSKKLLDEYEKIIDRVLSEGIVENIFLLSYAIKDDDKNRDLLSIDPKNKYGSRFIVNIEKTIDPYDSSIETCIKSYHKSDLQERKSITLTYRAWMMRDANSNRSKDNKKIIIEESYVIFQGFVFGDIFKSGICPQITKDNIIVTCFRDGKWVEQLSKNGDKAYQKIMNKRFEDFSKIEAHHDITQSMVEMADKNQYKIEYND